VPAAPVSMPSFKLIAPLRLNPAVRDALSAAIVSMNGDARAADAITVSAGVFVPLDHFKRRRVDVPLVLRSLAETGMTAGRGTAIAGTVQHEMGGRQQTGLVIKAGFVEGLDPSDFAPSS
jgi:conjugal transfer pilus assembly protein TraI